MATRDEFSAFPQLPYRLIGIGIIALILLIYLFSGWTTIRAGEVGILLKQYGTDRGMQKETLGPGSHWIEPFAYDVYIYDTRFVQKELTHTDAIPAGTLDGQPIQIDVSFQVGLDAANVPNLHQNVGQDWWNQLVLPLVRSTVRDETAKVSSQATYTGIGREQIQGGINAKLKEKLTPFGVRIETNLRDVRFDNNEFKEALNRKAIAEQQQEINRRQALAAVEDANRIKNVAEGARYQVEQVAQGERVKVEQAANAERERLRLSGEGERLQKEEQAKGILAIALAEAEGTRAKNAALSGPGGRNLVEIEWAHSLGPKLTIWGLPISEKSSTIVMDAMRGVSINAGGQ